MRPSLPKALEGHTISRRSAADGGADAPSTHHEDGERTASTLINASHQLSGGCRAVVRAECTAARLLARRSEVDLRFIVPDRPTRPLARARFRSGSVRPTDPVRCASEEISRVGDRRRS